MNPQQANRDLVINDPLVGTIHDRLLDDNQLNLTNAFNAACVEIAELYKELDKVSGGISSGYIRKKPD